MHPGESNLAARKPPCGSDDSIYFVRYRILQQSIRGQYCSLAV